MRADRLLSLLMMLQIKGSITAHELSQRLEVSERTIYRDIEALSTAGIPVYTERGPGGGCVLAEGYRSGLTGLTESEVSTLFMTALHRPVVDLGAEKSLEAALHKLMAALPTSHRHNIERTRERLYMDAVGWFRSEATPFLQTLRDAVWYDRKIQLTYRKHNGEVTERVVDPLGLVSKAGVWYMVALSHGELRVFRVSRVRDVLITEEPAERPEGFNLEQYWEKWSSEFVSTWPNYTATVRVSPMFVPILPRIMGESIHKLIETAAPPDAEGWIIVPLHFETFDAAWSYILGFGTMVEVLEPDELRQAVIQEATGIVEFYKDREAKKL